jgi:hypothetical protein
MGVKYMNKLEFEAKLNIMYYGAVTPMTRYLNERCSMLFHCNKCGVNFWGKDSHIVGKDHQKHICTMPYGDFHGELLGSVGFRPTRQNKKKSEDKGKKFYEMVINDYTPKEIAKELDIPLHFVKDYFNDEGLI